MCLIIGLGPAGSRAAEAAAKAGLHVIALEKRAAAGTPVQCAEFVPSMIERDVPKVGDVTEQMVARMLTFIEDDERPRVTPEFRGRMIDRAGFDAMLADNAARAGADCRYGVKVLRIERRRHRAHFGRRQLQTQGADRRRRAALARRRGRSARSTASWWKRGRSPCRWCCRTTPPTFSSAPITAAATAGCFPKGAVANVGLGVSIDGALPDNKSTRRGLKAMLMDLLTRLATERRIGTSGWALTGGAIPVGGRLKAIGKLGNTAVFLAGDAAGLTNPVTGAGIASAVQSGTMAGRAAVDIVRGRDTALDDYEEEFGEIFDAALNRALRRRREVLACYEGGGYPSRAALEDGWIGSPRYWRQEPMEETTEERVEERTR